MTVLQEYPVAIFLALIDELGGLYTLARAKTHDFKSITHTLSLCVVSHLLHGVHTLAEYEDDWTVRLRSSEEAFHRSHWANSIFWSQIRLEVLLNSEEYPLWLKAANKEDLFEAR